MVFDGEKSDTYSIKWGGSLFFILSVNDICDVSPLLFKILFADDTCVLLSGKNLNTLIALMNTKFISLNSRFKARTFPLTQKNHVFMISHKSRIKSNFIGSIILDSSKLIQVDYVKYLGVIIDYKLNWIEHIASVKNKISKGIGIMYKARQYLSKSTCLTCIMHIFTHI